MTDFLADAAVALAVIALVAVGGLVGLIAERYEKRIPYDDGRGERR